MKSRSEKLIKKALKEYQKSKLFVSEADTRYLFVTFCFLLNVNI